MTSSPDSLQARYARQIALPELGLAGQLRLQEGRVLLVGLGGLGSAAGFYLVAAGVGTIGLVDDDVVELSNLQRQIVHATVSVGKPKVESAAETFRRLNPEPELLAFPQRLTADNAHALVRKFDFVIDATDNAGSKLLIAEACHQARTSYSHAGITRFQGQTLTVLPGRTCCCRCVFVKTPAPPPAGVPQGPIGAVPGVIGAIQAMEAIKFLAGCGELLTDRLLTYDALTAGFRHVSVRRNPRCPLCGAP